MGVIFHIQRLQPAASRPTPRSARFINIDKPDTMVIFPFTGWELSFIGCLHAYSDDIVKFNAGSKTVVARGMYDYSMNSKETLAPAR